MTMREARNKIWSYRVIGAVLGVIGLVFTITSFLKYCYSSISIGSGVLEEMLMRPALIFVSYAYEYLLFPFWNIAPNITLNPLKTVDNIMFVLLYCLIFVGHIFLSRANVVAQHVRDVKAELAKDKMRRSMGVARPERSEGDIIVPMSKDEGWFSKVHALYIAPIIVAIILAYFKLN